MTGNIQLGYCFCISVVKVAFVTSIWNEAQPPHHFDRLTSLKKHVHQKGTNQKGQITFGQTVCSICVNALIIKPSP